MVFISFLSDRYCLCFVVNFIDCLRCFCVFLGWNVHLFKNVCRTVSWVSDVLNYMVTKNVVFCLMVFFVLLWNFLGFSKFIDIIHLFSVIGSFKLFLIGFGWVCNAVDNLSVCVFCLSLNVLLNVCVFDCLIVLITYLCCLYIF